MWLTLQNELAALQHGSVHVIAAQGDHDIPLNPTWSPAPSSTWSSASGSRTEAPLDDDGGRKPLSHLGHRVTRTTAGHLYGTAADGTGRVVAGEGS